MEKMSAYEGDNYRLHRNEVDAIVDILISAGAGTLRAALISEDPEYQPKIAAAIKRAAEMVLKNRKKRR